MVSQAFQWLTCPVCGYPKLVQVPTGGFKVTVIVREPWPIELEPPITKEIDELLDNYEQQIKQLEEAFKAAKAAEFYNNPYGTIEAHAVKLLGYLELLKKRAISYALPWWPLEQGARLESLISRVKVVIANCRAEAKRYKPIPPVEEEKDQNYNEWITKTYQDLWQQGTPDSTKLLIQNLRPTIPSLKEIISPERYLNITPIQPIGEYSVEEKVQSLVGQEEWLLAEAPAAVSWARKNWLPLTIMGGLGAAAMSVYLKKRKKRR